MRIPDFECEVSWNHLLGAKKRCIAELQRFLLGSKRSEGRTMSVLIMVVFLTQGTLLAAQWLFNKYWLSE